MLYGSIFGLTQCFDLAGIYFGKKNVWGKTKKLLTIFRALNFTAFGVFRFVLLQNCTFQELSNVCLFIQNAKNDATRTPYTQKLFDVFLV